MPSLRPILSLLRHESGVFDLYSVIVAPQTCYFAARAVAKAPAGVWVSDDTFAVTLNVVTSEDIPALQVSVPIVHEVANLPIKPEQKRILAFVCLNDRAVDSVEIALTAAQRVAEPSSGSHAAGERRVSTSTDGDGCWSLRGSDAARGAFWRIVPLGTERMAWRGSTGATTEGDGEHEGPFPLRLTSTRARGSMTEGDGEHEGPFPLRFASTRVHEAGDARLRYLGQIVLNLSRFYHGTGVASYLTLVEHPKRSQVACRHCGELWNTGSLLLSHARKKAQISLPYLTVHELAHHGVSRPDVDAELLGRVVNAGERRLGEVLGSCLAGTTPVPAGVTLEQHPLRGLEWCTQCGKSANLGDFTLEARNPAHKITLPYIAVHALADHGDPTYDGDAHRGHTPIEVLLPMFAQPPAE